MTRGQGGRFGLPARFAQGDSRPDLVEWRRIALDKQLPPPRFLGGLRGPSLICAWALVTLAVVSAVFLGSAGGDRAPEAVIDSQRELVRGLARSLNAAVTTGADQFEDATEDYAAAAQRSPATLLESVAAGRTRWAGLAVVRAADRQPLAVRGEPVPAELIPQSVTRITALPRINGAELQLLVIAPLPDGQLLAGTTVLRVRQLKLSAEGQQTVLVGLRTGESAAVQGIGVPGQSPLADPVRQAVSRAAGGDATTLTLPVVQPENWSAASPPVAIVVAAPVGEAGVAVASTVLAPLVDGGSRLQGVPAAAGLVAVAGLAYLVIQLGLVRPVRRLLAGAKAAACGDARPRTPMTRPWEARRIDRALNLTDQPGPRTGRRGLTVGGALVTATVLLLGWPVAVVATLAGGAANVPAQVVVDAENQVTSAAATLGEALDRGLTQVRGIASVAGENAVADRKALERLNRTETRYRSLYVTNQDGTPALVVGRAPLRRTVPLPDGGGVRLDNTSGRLPVIYVYALGAQGRTVVGEFDVDNLSDLLERTAGRARVVDSGLRTILDTEGYRAFQPLSDPPQRAAAIDALAGRTRASVANSRATGSRLISSAPVANPGSTAQLQWTVVVDWSITSLDLPPNTRRRTALAVAATALAIVLIAFGWQYFVFVRPLRRLADAADRLTEGDAGTAISPHRPDEIGAVAACLEICRQVRVDGEQRLGGAARLRGGELDHTAVFPVVIPRSGGRRSPRSPKD